MAARSAAVTLLQTTNVCRYQTAAAGRQMPRRAAQCRPLLYCALQMHLTFTYLLFFGGYLVTARYWFMLCNITTLPDISSKGESEPF